MAADPEIRILAPKVIRESVLPARWKRRGRFLDLAGSKDQALLARAFGIRELDLSAAAALHYLGATGRDPGGYCLFAYPVHLHPRREQLILMAGPEFEPDEAESQLLLADLVAHFPEWRIERSGDGMWFIIVDGDPGLETSPLEDVLGENIDDHLPRGRDAMAWHAIMNEVQMVLFNSKVNERREACGAPPVNSLWLWGGGRVPEIRVPRWKRVVSNDPVALGVARRAGIEALELDGPPSEAGGPDVEITGADTLWVYARPGEAAEKPVLAPRQWRALQELLRRGTLDALELLEPGYGALRIDARTARRWLPWR